MKRPRFTQEQIIGDHVPSRGVATALLSRVVCSIRLPGAAG
jgi:hypothetical protein